VVIWSKSDILGDCFFEQLCFRKLKYEAYPSTRTMPIPISPYILAIEQDGAGTGTQQGIEMLHKRGFSRPAWTDHGVDGTSCDRQIHRFKGGNRGGDARRVLMGQLPCLESFFPSGPVPDPDHCEVPWSRCVEVGRKPVTQFRQMQGIDSTSGGRHGTVDRERDCQSKGVQLRGIGENRSGSTIADELTIVEQKQAICPSSFLRRLSYVQDPKPFFSGQFSDQQHQLLPGSRVQQCRGLVKDQIVWTDGDGGGHGQALPFTPG
jgi:hypothetical protein